MGRGPLGEAAAHAAAASGRRRIETSDSMIGGTSKLLSVRSSSRLVKRVTSASRSPRMTRKPSIAFGRRVFTKQKSHRWARHSPAKKKWKKLRMSVTFGSTLGSQQRAKFDRLRKEMTVKARKHGVKFEIEKSHGATHQHQAHAAGDTGEELKIGDTVAFRHEFGPFTPGTDATIMDVRWHAKRKLLEFLVHSMDHAIHGWVPQYLPPSHSPVPNIAVIRKKAAAASPVPIVKQGNATYYTDENLAKRKVLFQSYRMQVMLGKLWHSLSAAHWPGDQLPRECWEQVMLAFAGVLAPDVSQQEMRQNLIEDWATDTGDPSGKAKVITRNQFLWSVFEIADQWLDSVDADAYIAFTGGMVEVVETHPIIPVPIPDDLGDSSEIVNEYSETLPALTSRPADKGDSGARGQSVRGGSARGRSKAQHGKTKTANAMGSRRRDLSSAAVRRTPQTDRHKTHPALKPRVDPSTHYLQPIHHFRPIPWAGDDVAVDAPRWQREQGRRRREHEGGVTPSSPSMNGATVVPSGSSIVYVDDGHQQPHAIVVPANRHEWTAMTTPTPELLSAADATKPDVVAAATQSWTSEPKRNSGIRELEPHHGGDTHAYRETVKRRVVGRQRAGKTSRRRRSNRGAKHRHEHTPTLRTCRQTVVGSSGRLRKAPRTVEERRRDPLALSLPRAHGGGMCGSIRVRQQRQERKVAQQFSGKADMKNLSIYERPLSLQGIDTFR